MDLDKIRFDLGSSISTDCLDDWLFIMTRKNANRLQSIPETTGMFSCPRAVEFIFFVCDRLRMSEFVKQATVVLFDSFMINHVESLYNHVYQSSTLQQRLKNWQCLEDKIANQITLRVLSCVQIASKLDSTLNSLSLNGVREFLRKLGHCYTKDNVLNSEVRVLKTWDYKVNVITPHDYVETLFKLLQENKYLDEHIDELYECAIEILDFVILVRDDIYKRLISDTLKTIVPDRRQIASVEMDYMLLGAAIITTSNFIVDGIDVADRIACNLFQITRIPLEDIQDFCNAIVSHTVAVHRNVAK